MKIFLFFSPKRKQPQKPDSSISKIQRILLEKAFDIIQQAVIPIILDFNRKESENESFPREERIENREFSKNGAT